MAESPLPPISDAEVRAHLAQEYDRIFTAEMLEGFFDEYVGFTLADPQVGELAHLCPPSGRVLDVGCGYGSFVLAARRRGFDAVGVEVAEFELNYARRRLAAEEPGIDPAEVYVGGDGRCLPFETGTVDAVTLWNVVEHVLDVDGLLGEAMRVLRPGGVLLLVAPNYLAFRREAHYHVPWLPLLPRRIAHRYLECLGRDPSFFDEQIHYCTNRGVQRMIREHGGAVRDPRAVKVSNPDRLAGRRRAVVERLRSLHLARAIDLVLRAGFANPFRASIVLLAVKTGNVDRRPRR